MSRLENLSKDKNTILMRLLGSQGLCKALKYKGKDFLDQPDIEDPSELLFTNIFPYFRVPSVTEEAETFILLSFRDYRPVRNKDVFKSGFIDIYTITHKNLVETDYGFLRYDFMMSEVDKLMNETRGIGIGKVEFSHMDEVVINNEHYLGNVVKYKIYEWN